MICKRLQLLETLRQRAVIIVRQKVDMKREPDPVLMIHVWRAIDGGRSAPAPRREGRAKAERKRQSQ